MRLDRLHLIAFSSGSAVMVLELLGTRVLAPYLGLSLYVWTSVIGVILGALALGYALGGRLADRHPTPTALRRILLTASASVAVLTALKDLVPALVVNLGPLFGSLVASTILLVPASTLLAMVTPYAVKLQLKHLKETGATAGNLYAAATIGSIVGTFLAGYVLIPQLQTSTTLTLLAGALLATGLLAGWPRRRALASLAALLLGAAAVSRAIAGAIEEERRALAVVPSAYAVITVLDRPVNGRPARLLLTDVEVDSGMYRDSEELVFPYTEFFGVLDEVFRPAPRRALLLGGGAYSMAKDFLQRFPDGAMDVVEIDPRITRVAAQYFRLPETPRLTTVHEDGRTFLNRRAATYDVIYNDTFSSSFAIPWQLTTREAVQAMADNLVDNGVVLVNVISALDGPGAAFFFAEHRTFQAVFPHVYAFAVDDPGAPTLVQNIVLVGVKDPAFALPDAAAAPAALRPYLARLVRPALPADTAVLTDEFAPVDYYITKLRAASSL